MNTQNTTPETRNPQQSVPANGASNAADFQSTAPDSALRAETQDLNVQQTGEPAAPSVKETTSDASFYFWAGGVALLIIVGIFLLIRLIKEAVEENMEPAMSKPAKITTTKQAKTQSKSVARKASSKKKPASGSQKRKKTTRSKK